ncbi:MAG TPA: cytochrome c oxidase assembly protein [Gaiellaceae bacterium]|nr:cytochrome c oxidase assembly protein [Gaiellaceae bacterium]
MGVWRFELMPLVAGAVTLELYAQGFARLRRRRRDLVGWGHAALFGAGVVVAVLAVTSPIDEIGEDKLLSVHMIQHLLLVDVSPLLIVLGLRGPMAFFLLPARPLRGLAHVRALRALLSFLLRPWVSFGVWALAMGAWHVPAAYDAAIAHPDLHIFEHATFVLAGLLVWTQIVDPTRRARLTPGGRAVFAGSILLAGMAISEVLLLAGPLYPHYVQVQNRPFGLTAAEDQNRAALLMMAEQLATLGSAAALLLWSHAERVEQELLAQFPAS